MRSTAPSPSPLAAFLLGALPPLGFLAATWMEAGPYAWLALAQLRLFGSYSEKVTFIGSVVLWILLGLALLFAYQRLQSDPTPAAPAPAGPDPAWVLAGVGAAGLLVMGLGLLAALRPLPGRDLNGLRAALPMARLWPRPVQISLQDLDALDEARQVGQKRGDDLTYYAPLHAEGARRVQGVCAGAPEAWKTLGDPAAALLVVEPVPVLIRHQFEEAGLETPLFRPVLLWGQSPWDAGMPWILAGLVTLGLALYLGHGVRKRRRAETAAQGPSGGRPL